MGGKTAKILTLDVVFVVRGLAAASVVQPVSQSHWGRVVRCLMWLRKCVVPGKGGELLGCCVVGLAVAAERP